MQHIGPKMQYRYATYMQIYATYRSQIGYIYAAYMSNSAACVKTSADARYLNVKCLK